MPALSWFIWLFIFDPLRAKAVMSAVVCPVKLVWILIAADYRLL